MLSSDFKCPNEECEFHQKPAPLAWSPEDGANLYLACPECRQISSHPGLPEDNRGTRKVWVQVRFTCKTGASGHPASFYALVPDTEDRHMRTDLRRKLEMKYWTGTLSCGHTLPLIEDDLFSFESMKRRVA